MCLCLCAHLYSLFFSLPAANGFTADGHGRANGRSDAASAHRRHAISAGGLKFFLTIVYLDVPCMCSAYVFLFKYVSPRSCLCDLFQYSHTFQETMIGVSANLANATDASAHTYIQSAANNQGATKPVPRRYTQMSFGNQNQVCLLCMH